MPQFRNNQFHLDYIFWDNFFISPPIIIYFVHLSFIIFRFVFVQIHLDA